MPGGPRTVVTQDTLPGGDLASQFSSIWYLGENELSAGDISRLSDFVAAAGGGLYLAAEETIDRFIGLNDTRAESKSLASFFAME